MQKIYLLTGCMLFLPLLFFGQQRLIQYKIIAEKEIQRHFEFPLIKTKCTVESKTNIDSTESLFTGNYTIEEKDEESFLNITLEYSVFSDEIDDWYPILITINNNKIIDFKKTNFGVIPPCILRNQGCNYIKRDSAIKIAIKDSILYPDNLNTSFWVDEKTLKCFWSVIGYSDTHSKTGSESQYRRIDALTGKIIK
jgi:hypothetical protein